MPASEKAGTLPGGMQGMADKSKRRGLSTPGVSSRVDTNELYPLTFQVVNVAAPPDDNGPFPALPGP